MDHFLKISSNSEVVMLESSEKFVELTRNDPIFLQARCYSCHVTNCDAASNHSHPALFVVDSLPQILQ